MTRHRELMALTVRIALAAVFAAAALPKLAEPHAFAIAVLNYDILHGNVAVNLVAVTLPMVELLAAVLLLAGLRVRAAAGVCLLLLIVFLAGLVSAVARGLDINCGCFDPSGTSSIGWWDITRSVLLVGLAMLCMWLGPGRWSVDGRLTPWGIPRR